MSSLSIMFLHTKRGSKAPLLPPPLPERLRKKIKNPLNSVSDGVISISAETEKHIERLKSVQEKKVREQDKRVRKEITLLSKNLISAINNIDKYEYVLTSEYEELMRLNKEKIKDIRFELRSNADIGYEKDVIRARQREYTKMLKNGKITLSNEISGLKSLYDNYENKAEGIRIAILSKLEQVEKYMRTGYKKPTFEVSDSVKEKSEHSEKIRKKELLKRERRFEHLEKELSREIKPFPSQDVIEIQNAIKAAKEPIDNIELNIPDDIRRINQKIIVARDSLLSTDLDSAKNIYLEIISLYNELPDERKLKVYEVIKELYDERKSAEKVFIKRLCIT